MAEANASSTSPIPLTAFPPAVQRAVDPKSPVPVRMMAAKGIIACPPRDLLTALFTLTFDPDPKVAETANGSAAALPGKLLSGLRDHDLDPLVLSFYAIALAGNAQALEMIALNPSTPDEAMAEMSKTAPDAIVEIISQNQLRILRDERIVRGIVANPNARLATKDTLLDFCVRSGMILADMPEYLASRKRILGEDPAAAAALQQSEQNTADAVTAAFGNSVTVEGAPMTEEQRLTFTQRVMKMSVAQKIKLATLGNKEARTMLLRDSNKLVALAAVQSPRITDGEVLGLSNSRTLHDEVMRYILRNRDWLKNYQVKVNLANNPKTPIATGIKLLQFLHPNELKVVARNKNIAKVLQNQARGHLLKKEQSHD